MRVIFHDSTSVLLFLLSARIIVHRHTDSRMLFSQRTSDPGIR